MSAALAHHRSTIRIFRSGWLPARGVPFQPEWAPVSDPYTEDHRARCAPPRLRVPQSWHAALTGTALTVALTAVVSLGMAIRTAGLTLDAGAFWLAAWQFAALIAVPTRFVLAPLVTKAVGLLVEPSTDQSSRISPERSI